MKIRKTRIKKTTKANGSVKYVAEYKWGFWWYQMNDWFGPSSQVVDSYRKWVVDVDELTGTEQEAKALIDFYIERVKYQNSCEVENKVVKVEYEEYP